MEDMRNIISLIRRKTCSVKNLQLVAIVIIEGFCQAGETKQVEEVKRRKFLNHLQHYIEAT